jgi:ADP-ribose pyrophosphatase
LRERDSFAIYLRPLTTHQSLIMQILDVRKLTDERWLNLFAARFEHNGHEGRWLFASRRQDVDTRVAGDAVVIVPVLREEGREPRLVLIKEYRVPVGGYLYALPAGLLDAGESVEEAARRELTEETGLTVTAVKRASPLLLSSAGLTDESAHLIFVDAVSTPGTKPKLEASEELETILLDFAGVCKLCDDPSARFDVRAWMVLYQYQLLGKIV